MKEQRLLRELTNLSTSSTGLNANYTPAAYWCTLRRIWTLKRLKDYNEWSVETISGSYTLNMKITKILIKNGSDMGFTKKMIWYTTARILTKIFQILETLLTNQELINNNFRTHLRKICTNSTYSTIGNAATEVINLLQYHWRTLMNTHPQKKIHRKVS